MTNGLCMRVALGLKYVSVKRVLVRGRHSINDKAMTQLIDSSFKCFVNLLRRCQRIACRHSLNVMKFS